VIVFVYAVISGILYVYKIKRQTFLAKILKDSKYYKIVVNLETGKTILQYFESFKIFDKNVCRTKDLYPNIRISSIYCNIHT